MLKKVKNNSWIRPMVQISAIVCLFFTKSLH